MSSTTTEDRRGRPVRDLRISVTDRCNMRCRYCMPREVFGPDHAFLPRAELLTFEEIERVTQAAVDVGVEKVRLTGGEPLLRRDLPDLVARLAAIDGIRDLAATTNATLLTAMARPLKDAGLHRLTVSLDALDDTIFRAMSDVALPVTSVLDGIAAAQEAGFTSIKINAVVQRGVNEDQLVPLAEYGREHGITVRFIEFMDVGASNGWQLEQVVSARDIVSMIHAVHPLEPVTGSNPSDVARRHRFLDGRGEIGVIASVTDPFCGDCTRLRLSAVGELFTCLFATVGTDLRATIRGGADDDELRSALGGVWARRTDRYSELRSADTPRPDGDRVEMSYIGG